MITECYVATILLLLNKKLVLRDVVAEVKRERLQDFLTAVLDADAIRLPVGRAAGELRQYREMGDRLAVEYSVAIGYVESQYQSLGVVNWD